MDIGTVDKVIILPSCLFRNYCSRVQKLIPLKHITFHCQKDHSKKCSKIREALHLHAFFALSAEKMMKCWMNLTQMHPT